MACKLRKALGAVKDQTSISIAKVTNAANLEVNILKATTHDEIPMENRYVKEIVQLVSSNKVYAAACAQFVGKRIGKTRNWVVALKSLMLVLRIFQDGDLYFPREIFHAMKRGAKILNLSSFKDDSCSNSWDFTAFVRTFGLYLDERLDCFLTGKLQRRFTYHHNRTHEIKSMKNNKLSNEPGIKDMKPTMVLDKITYWQKLLDRAIGSRPTGSAKKNSLVQVSLYAIVQESFDLYRDISDGLAVVLDSFFQLPYRACVVAFKACVKSSKQFDELSEFYSWCASLGIGRTSEYPRVQKISDELMETLQEFLKDQTSFSANNCQSPLSKQLTPPKDPRSSLGQDEAFERYGTPERTFETRSENGSTSLEDLMSATDAGLTPARSLEQDFCSVHFEQDEKQSPNDDSAGENDEGSTYSLPIDQTTRPSFEKVSFDYLQQEEQHSQTKEQEQQNTTSGSNDGSRDCWELVLAETATKPEHASPRMSNGIDPLIIDTLFDQPSLPEHQYNPFLEDIATITPSTTENKAGFTDYFVMAPKFSAQNPSEATIAPTFTVQSSNSETSLALIFGDLNPTGFTMVPTLSAQGSSETNMAVGPNFHAQSSDEITAAPTFYARGSYEIGSTPTFHAHNSNETSTVLTFSTQNVDMAMAAPTFASQNFNETKVPSDFWAHNFDDTKAAPTFSARNSNDTMVTTPTGDDPFGVWPSAKTNEHASIELIQEQSLLHQQQMWLEQQNKIIAKRMA